MACLSRVYKHTWQDSSSGVSDQQSVGLSPGLDTSNFALLQRLEYLFIRFVCYVILVYGGLLVTFEMFWNRSSKQEKEELQREAMTLQETNKQLNKETKEAVSQRKLAMQEFAEINEM